MGRSGIAIVVAALMICGCGSPVARAPVPERPDLVFEFRLTSKPGVMDQILLIGNWGKSAVAPVLELTALDASGDLAGAREVEDVRAEVTSSDQVALEATGGELITEHLDRRGRPVDLATYFDGYRVTNDNDAEAKVRVVLIEWENPPPGESQQALRVTPVSPLMTLAPNAKKTVRLPQDLRGRVIGTVKAYYSR